jgi:hypothetical protein
MNMLMNQSPNTTDRNRGGFAERLATGLLVAFFTGLGWVTLIDGGISLHGKTGAVSHLTGAATFAAAVLLHPALYLLCPA